LGRHKKIKKKLFGRSGRHVNKKKLKMLQC
jgi:hypothetical protein